MIRTRASRKEALRAVTLQAVIHNLLLQEREATAKDEEEDDKGDVEEEKHRQQEEREERQVRRIEREAVRKKSTRGSRDQTPVSERRAAVLIALFESDEDGEVHVLLTRRSPTLRSHGGEVCLPGGKRDPEDVDDVDTALRETEEELGLSRKEVNIVSQLPPVLSKHFLSVTAVIGTVSEATRRSVRPNAEEVEHVFSVPLRTFLTSGPRYSYRDVYWEPAGVPYRLHSWIHTDQENGVDHVVWGLTAAILIMAAQKAFNIEPDFSVSPPGAHPYSALAYENGQLVIRTKSNT